MPPPGPAPSAPISPDGTRSVGPFSVVEGPLRRPVLGRRRPAPSARFGCWKCRRPAPSARFGRWKCRSVEGPNGGVNRAPAGGNSARDRRPLASRKTAGARGDEPFPRRPTAFQELTHEDPFLGGRCTVKDASSGARGARRARPSVRPGIRSELDRAPYTLRS